MFVKSIRSTISYALFYNVHKSTISLIKQPTTTTIAAIACNYQPQQQQRSYCERTNRRLFDYHHLQTTKSIINNNNKNSFSCFISHRLTSSQTTTQSNNLKNMLNYLPFFASGEIVSGFGRGSKELGIPTANYPLDVVKSLPDCFQPGVYFGWANVDNGPVYKMVMSIGWNPFYDNKEKSMETHILHDFNRDLYGCLLKLCIVGYSRPEQNFKTLDDLIECIKNDITQAEDVLESNEAYKTLQNHQFFLESGSGVSNSNHKNGSDSKNIGS